MCFQSIIGETKTSRSLACVRISYQLNVFNSCFDWFIARGPQIDGEKPGSVTHSTDREDEVTKKLVIYLLCLTGSGPITASNF